MHKDAVNDLIRGCWGPWLDFSVSCILRKHFTVGNTLAPITTVAVSEVDLQYMTSASSHQWQTSQNLLVHFCREQPGAAEMGLLHLPAACIVMAAECSGSRCSVTQGGIVKYETSNVKGDGLNIKPEFCLCLQHETDLPLFTVSLCCGIYSWNIFMWVSWQCW